MGKAKKSAGSGGGRKSASRDPPPPPAAGDVPIPDPADNMPGFPGSSNQDEEQRLAAISIMQQFAWLRRSSTHDDNLAVDASPFLHDLILWNILGFAVDESSYLSLMLVNHDWKDMVLLLEPPGVFKMSMLLRCSDMISLDDMELLRVTFESMTSRDCPLYRSDADPRAFPHIQPHFNVTLMRFAYAVSTQRTPNNYSRQLYQLTTDFLNTTTKPVVEKVWDAMLPLRQDSTSTGVEEVLTTILDQWREWKGITDRVVGIADYLDRYYVRHHHLTPLKEVPAQAMATGLVRKVSQETQQPSLPLVLLAKASKLDMDGPERRRLLLEASRACETLASTTIVPILPIPTSLLVLRQGYQARLESFFASALEEARAEEQQAKEEAVTEGAHEAEPVTLISSDKTCFPLPLDSHFLKSSSFLSKLYLKPGDVVKLNFGTYTMVKAIEFYGEDEVRPMPEIPRPIQSRNLTPMIGQTYADFLDSMEQGQLFSVLTFANLMDFPALLNLCCAGVASMIRGRSVEEIRQTFNITNDLSPEEEREVRAENRAFLRRALHNRGRGGRR